MELIRNNDLKALILGLSLLEGVGWKTVRYTVQVYLKHGEEALISNELTKVLHKGKIPNYKEIASKIVADRDKIKEKGWEEHDKLANKGIELLVGDELPPFISHFNGEKPLWLFVKGNKDLLYSKDLLYIGVVGTRNPSHEAKNYIRRLMWLFCRYPVVVVSGLAEGIDLWTHTISMEWDMKNIAFLGHGIYVSTSKESKKLMNKLVESGGVVATEYFPKERYNKERFLRRNRLIASLSEILIPVQANVPSGTFSTVFHALKKNKPVVGIKMNNSEIVQFLTEKGYVVLDMDQDKDIIYLDELLRNKLKQKGIKFDVITTFKQKIERLVDVELSYRFVDKEFYSEMKSFLQQLIERVELKLESKDVDRGSDSTP